MRLLLVRHGNTFGPGDPVVWVGAGEDFPLVESGRAQAEMLGGALKAQGLVPDRIVTGPLIRTREHADLVARASGCRVARAIDERLTEIHYGAWGGLTSDEIAERFGPQAAADLDAWGQESRWPASAPWSPDESTLRARVKDLAMELTTEPAGGAGALTMVVSSNGVLRYFLDLVAGGRRAQSHKMATGAASLLEFGDRGAEILFWNRKAQDWARAET